MPGVPQGNDGSIPTTQESACRMTALLLPYTVPRDIDYLGRVVDDPLAPTSRRWVRRLWATTWRATRRQVAPCRWPRCVRRSLWATRDVAS